MTAICVGERLDWITVAFRVVVDDAVLELLGAVAKRLERFGRVAFAHGGFSGEVVSHGGGRTVVSDKFARVCLWPTAPGAADEGGIHGAGWTVAVDVSGAVLAACGWRKAIREAWRIARCFGKVRACRFRRLDLTADFLAFPFAKSDIDAAVRRSRRAPSAYYGVTGTDGQETLSTCKVDPDDAAIIEHGPAESLESVTFGRGGAVQCRIYRKTLELMRKDADVRGIEYGVWNEYRAWTLEGGARAPWQRTTDDGEIGPNVREGVDEVTRVEFQLSREALDELSIRCETVVDRENLETAVDASIASLAFALDEVWCYCVGRSDARGVPLVVEAEAPKKRKRKLGGWVRLVEPMHSRAYNDATDERWRVVQAVEFVRSGAPMRVRVSRRSRARESQLRGCQLSILAYHGELEAPTTPGGVAVPVGAEEEAAQKVVLAKGERGAKEYAQRVWTQLGIAAARRAAADAVDGRDGADALALLFCRMNAARARFAGLSKVYAAPAELELARSA